MTNSKTKAIFWDFGGVFTTSPFAAFNKYEATRGIPENFIRTLNATNSDANAWAKLERSEVSIEEFCTLFEQEALAKGVSLDGTGSTNLYPRRNSPRYGPCTRSALEKI